MRDRLPTVAAALTFVVAGVTLAPVIGQAPSDLGKRTPWGDPDLQGIWNSKTITPLQRPDEFADRPFLTDEEAAALELEAQTTPVRDGPARAERGTRADVDRARSMTPSCHRPASSPGSSAQSERRW